ncbi:MAG: Excinuclease ABC C subunit domain protein [Candidatus Curtissbacteria bacterium GW2011_GWA1_40_9]|uniref:Excinuclease ABC C subunit domain protein n=1 Tax=Candidatus Curtissbacteria bacterium GW2011_GWA1_40_9 TaxID=1618408 RepID=A0A0G0TMS8_9BACT|nr:MAG: Excinuclease ABC C subunit domain protein [Candidatus Curtissbacteria bacterium GW2011_GWA1_40_9]
MYYVYVLKSLKDKKHYIGSTSDLKIRLEKHNQGLVKSTKHRRPLELIYAEAYKTNKASRQREFTIKKMKGGIQFKQLINTANIARV